MATFSLKSFEFRHEREKTWLELEKLVTRAESGGLRSLSAGELTRLPILYRAVLSSLSVSRAISLDRNVVEYLEGLAGRAYFCVYGTKRQARETVSLFFRERFPESVRRFRRHVAVAAFFMLLGCVTGLVMTARDPDRFYAFVDEAYSGGRNPAASTEELRSALYHTENTSSDTLVQFAMFLFTHNAQIGMLAFALGFAAGVPTVFLLFVNGLVLGAFGALYWERGLAVEFWAWVLPHGVTELLAVVLCGGAGLALAESLLLPGRHGRLENLGLQGRQAGVVVLGAVALFFGAGLIEGIFRQLVTSVPIRAVVATASAIFWIAYFSLAGRAGARSLEPGGRSP